MYFEECIIDGFLCYRTRPEGDFKPYTAQQLTAKLMEARNGKVQAPAAPLVWPTIESPAQPAPSPAPQPWKSHPWQFPNNPYNGVPDWTAPILFGSAVAFSSVKS